jgi:uncharacterized protein
MLLRIYTKLIEEHLKNYNQMVFIVGPRQSGKTTTSQLLSQSVFETFYLNWDNLDHRKLILDGPESLARHHSLATLSRKKKVIIFDEIHKYRKWRSYVKGFFDTYKKSVSIIVTGSSKLDILNRGGDSLMGRYFLYRLHPLTLSELKRASPAKKEISPPKKPNVNTFHRLLKYGGYPDPYLKKSSIFLNRWMKLRNQQLFREDIRDLSRIQDLHQLELLAHILESQSGQLVNYSSLSNKIRTSVDTARRWLKTLETFYFCFLIKPWSKNVPRSLLKEPKAYLWNWTSIQDEGSRFENFISLHLLKAAHFWSDMGLGNYKLWFLRDKNKREVDFLVTRNEVPWVLVEAKLSQKSSLNPNLFYYQKKLKAAHAFQVVCRMNYIQKDCFQRQTPTIVPAETFLSQLV